MVRYQFHMCCCRLRHCSWGHVCWASLSPPPSLSLTPPPSPCHGLWTRNLVTTVTVGLFVAIGELVGFLIGALNLFSSPLEPLFYHAKNYSILGARVRENKIQYPQSKVHSTNFALRKQSMLSSFYDTHHCRSV